ncbi:MAG: hypothetical protein K2P78_06975 [Gemmataceae bacterium]|nr:hypothetical protein [Gemmataceae bacterium]
MYPSGSWEGFWQQEHYGRQAMREFRLAFRDGRITGGGSDVVGRFTFAGEYDEATGRVRMVKQYVDRHAVAYVGSPDGEGCIAGTWSIGEHWTGSFLMRPVLRRPRGDEPVQEIG